MKIPQRVQQGINVIHRSDNADFDAMVALNRREMAIRQKNLADSARMKAIRQGDLATKSNM